MSKLFAWARKESLQLAQLVPAVLALLAAVVALVRQPIVWIFDFWFTHKEAELLATGVFNTVAISGISIVAGTVVGVALAYLVKPIFSNQKFLSIVARATLYVALAVPVYVLLVFGIGLFTSPYWTAITFLSLNLAVFVCRLVVRAFETLPQSQIEAAWAAGARGWSLRIHFEFPALWRSCGAGITNEWATTLKLSSLVGVVGAYDIMKSARILLDETYNTRVFLVVVVVYAVLTVPIFMLSDRYTRQHG